MDSSAIILLIVVLMSAIVWAITARKLRARNEYDYRPLERREETYDTAEARVVEEAAEQITIYQNHVKKDVICCPHCDGENPRSAAECGTCGAAL